MEVLLNYFFVFIGKESLKGDEDICFIYNANKINSNYFKTEVGTFFGKNKKPKIMITDSKRLI